MAEKKVIETIYSYKDILTCECIKKDSKGKEIISPETGKPVKQETPLSYGNKKEDIQPEPFKATKEDKCDTCKGQFKFKERIRTVLVTTKEETKI
jgi:hypothetical protein